MLTIYFLQADSLSSPPSQQPTTVISSSATPFTSSPLSFNAVPNTDDAGNHAPAYTLFPAWTVRDAWREWDIETAGRQPLKDLEARWGPLLRPEPCQRTAWSRRKVIINEIRSRLARGATIEAAVTQLERQHAGRSLRKLIDELIAFRQHKEKR